jgi:hypothetical protein
MKALEKVVLRYDKILTKHIYENSIVLLYTLGDEASLKEANTSMKTIISKINASLDSKIEIHKQHAMNTNSLDKALNNKNSHLYIYLSLRQNLNTSCSLFKSLRDINYPLS